jgi:Photosynthesis system II assembly factor YCF48
MAAREEDKAMAGLLRRSLAQDAAAGPGSGWGGDCPEPEILAAYFDHALDAQETARYDLHFSRCSVCREQLTALARASDVPDAKDAEKKNAGAWGWFTAPRWLMPAAAALVALLVIGGIAVRMRKPAVSATEIAMSRPDAVPTPNSSPPANSVPAPEAPPSSDMALQSRSAQALRVLPSATTENPIARVPETSQRDVIGAPAKPGESDKSRALGATSAAGGKAGVSHANSAARRDELSSRGAASANRAVTEAAPQPQIMSALKSPAMDRGAMRAGSGGGVSAETTDSADATANVAVNGVAQDKALAPAAPAAKKAEAGSVESDTNVAVQTDETEEANAAKTKLPETAAPSRSVTAMNLTASKATGAAALAKLQEAQISSNLMNLQIQTPDPKILWMVASPGVIEKSEDGGTTWKPEYVDTRALLLAGAAPTVKICWVVGANGTILRTTNGSHWKTIRPPLETNFVRVEAADASSATLTAMDGRKFATADGGKSWSGVK